MSVALGALLAAAHLVSLPVEVMKTAPKEAPAPEKRYVVLGASGSGGAWESKRDQAESGVPGGEIVLPEAELNAWAEGTFEPVKPDAAQKSPTMMISAGTPNFRVDGDSLRIALENKVYFFGTEGNLVLHARGGFEREGEGWTFRASEALLGALPLHKVPGLLPLVAARFSPAEKPEAVAKVLARAKNISVRDGAVVIEMP